MDKPAAPGDPVAAAPGSPSSSSASPTTPGSSHLGKAGQPDTNPESQPARWQMRAGLRRVLVALTLGSLVLTTWLAQRQQPHPDMFRAIGDWDIGQPGWWGYPLERNAFKRQIVRGDLQAVFVLPQTQKLWAVGEGGLILHSSDDGLTWVQQRPALPAAQAATAPRVGAAWSLMSQAMAQEAPNLKQPAPQTQKGGPPPNSIANVISPSAGLANQMALPADTAAARGTDPVQTSRPAVRAEGNKKAATTVVQTKAPAAASPASAASVPSAAASAAVGGRVDVAETAHLKAVYFVNERNGWAVGHGGTILATTDGGASWAVQTSGSRADLSSLQFSSDGRRGWAVGDGGTILATTNGGATWAAQTSGRTAWLSGLHFSSDGQRGWAVGNGGTILATTNGGAIWAAQTSGSTTWLSGVQFSSDGLRGWAVGNGGTILGTTDGGANWVAQTSGSTVWLNGVQISSDGQRGWAVGGSLNGAGTILATTNGGATWARQTSGSTSFLSSVQFSSDGQRGWVAGHGGTILATVDGGTQWTARSSGRQLWLNGLRMETDGQHGLALSGSDMSLVTSNAGATWSVQQRRVDSSASQVPGNRNRLLESALASRGISLRTIDLGTGLERPGTPNEFNASHFGSDGQRGWAVGDSGTIVSTFNRGLSWEPQTSGTRARLSRVEFNSDNLRGWAVGQYGTVLATTNGGKDWSSLATYQRMWAPWYFVALVVLALALFALLGLIEPLRAGAPADGEAGQPSGGAATLLSSDQPVADKLFDRLGVKPAVEALSSFIRNAKTEPRVTVAVTGEWGNGKSSVMRMLQTELDRAGFRSAWFNAWHHQQEGRQMSALFNVVHQQAVPQWWRQPLSALRVRSRLIWGRGWFYRLVSVALALVLALLLGDMLADGVGIAGERVRLSTAHHLLQRQHTAITGASLAKLDPFAPPASAPVAAATASAAGAASSAAARVAAVQRPATSVAVMGRAVVPAGVVAAAPSPAASAVPADPCSDPSRMLAKHKPEHIRPELYCYLQRNLQWSESGDNSHCGVHHKPPADPARRCVFATAQDLLATIEARGATGANKLWPSERKAILAAAETLPPAAVFPWLEHSLLGGLAGVLLLLFGKGIAVYGVQLTTPLRTLLAAGLKDTGAGKEASGTVERYRAEFGLLCDALDGRLVIFIDDLDRCTPETVNGMLELTNYLVDVGKCFVVMGAAMDRVKRCVRSPETNAFDEAYAIAYLRKLVHIELPVPQNRALLNSLANAAPIHAPGQAERATVKRLARRTGVVLGVIGVVLAFYWGGQGLHDSAKGKPLDVREPMVAAAVGPGLGASAVAPSAPTAGLDPLRVERSGAVGLDPTPATPWPVPWLAAAVALALAGAGWRWLRRHREQVVLALGGAIRTTDSNRFMQALAIWNPVVVSHDPTPRHVKRFYNRARLFAAYEQQDAAGDVTADECLVALAAMHHLDPAALGLQAQALEKSEASGVDAVAGLEAWLSEMYFNVGLGSSPGSDPLVNARRVTLSSAWREHISTFKSAPSATQMRRFASRVEGILVR